MTRFESGRTPPTAVVRHWREQQEGGAILLQVSHEFVEAQLDDLAVFHGDRLLAPFAGTMTEFAEDFAGLMQAQNQFTSILGQRGQFHKTSTEEKDALRSLAKAIDKVAFA
jgi:hypothetical protein